MLMPSSASFRVRRFRAGWTWALTFTVALASAGCAGLPTLEVDGRAPSPQEAGPRSSWWFPYDIAVGQRQTFHVTVDSKITDAGRARDEHEEADFTVEIVEDPSQAGGCLVRLVPPPPEQGDRPIQLTDLWLRGLADNNPTGIRVAREALLLNDGPLLHGPWRPGDRFSLAGFFAYSIFMKNELLLGFNHFEVARLTPDSVELRFEFWLGEGGPAMRGDGTLRFVKDANGIARVNAAWQRRSSAQQKSVRLAIERTAAAPI